MNAMAQNKQMVQFFQGLKSLLNSDEHDCVGPEA